jgi:hypothetical protein
MHPLLILSLVAGLSGTPQLPLPSLGMRIDSADCFVRTASITCDTSTLGNELQVVYFPVTLEGIDGILALRYDSTQHLTNCLWTTANPGTHASFAYLVTHHPNSSFAQATLELKNNATQKQFYKLLTLFERVNGPEEPHSETSDPKFDVMWDSANHLKTFQLEQGRLSYSSSLWPRP